MDKLQLAGCILLNEQGKILLVHRNTDKYNHWEVPGGKIEPGEEAAQAATRELQEELGVRVNLEKEIGHATFMDGRPMRYRWFLARTEGMPRICEPDTFDDIAYFSIDELVNGRLALSEGAKRLVSQLKTGKITL